MKSSTTFFALLISCIIAFMGSDAFAQPCFSGYQYDMPGCPGLNTVSSMANTPNITNTYSWPTTITGGTLVSGQGMQTAVYDFTSPGHKTIVCTIYNSAYACTYNVVLHYYVAQYSTLAIQGTMPTTCSGSQVFTYYATRWQDAPNGFINHMENHYWTINGGTQVSQTTTVLSGQSPYGWAYVDTLKVMWNGTGQRNLILHRTAADQNGNVPGVSSCPAYDTLFPANGPATITGPSTGCVPFAATYTVNADTGYTYSWAITGSGTFLSSTNTPSVQVNWTGPGTITVTKSFLWCPMTFTATRTVSASTVPTPNLGPNTTFCQNSGFSLNAGPGQSYLWNSGATTQTIFPTASGTYSVTVTNGGCTGTSTVTLTMLPSPTLSIAALPVAPCQGASALLMASGTWATYLWSTGATTPSITVTTSGTYGLTVTDMNGCSASAALSLVFAPSPTFSLGNDSIICADTTVILNGPPGAVSYQWSNAAISSSIVVGNGGIYSLTVTDANGCTASDDIVITGLTDCVFPGDANYDGVADNQDVLSIGAYYGFMGATRPGATTQWYGQSLTDWGGALPGHADPKHSDCNGDGIVAAADTLAVLQNYGSTHSKANGISTVGADLRVIPLQDSIYPGFDAWFMVVLGDAQNQVDSVYGLAFQIAYNGNAVGPQGLGQLDYQNCWFAPPANALTLTKNMNPLQRVDAAAVRKDQVQQTGYGEVCSFSIATDPNLLPTSDFVHVTLTNVSLVSSALTPIPVVVHSDSMIVSHLAIGTAETLAPLHVYPNPATDALHISQQDAELLNVKVLDATGREIGFQQGIGGHELLLSTADFSDGMYFLKVSTSAGQYLRKLIVKR